MVATLWILLWLAAAAFALVGAVRLRARLRAHVDRRPTLDDADVRRIVDTGVFVSEEDEPLDLDQVEAEERRFWEEAEWDEAEEL